MRDLSIPAIGVLNQFLMGDTVLTESIARNLAFSQQSYVISNYPELFMGHPSVIGVRSYSELPENTRIIDLTKSIQSIEARKNGKVVIPNKFLNMCKDAGFNRKLDRPTLYLTAKEASYVHSLQEIIPNRPNIGVALTSAHRIKNWRYLPRCLDQLSKEDCNIFLFADKMCDNKTIINGCYPIIGKDLRTMMQYISMMDIMIGPDTGPMHVAGALGIPLVVICLNVFQELYSMYENAITLGSDNISRNYGIKGISINKVLNGVHSLIGKKPIRNQWMQKRQTTKKHAFIRIRGLGDLLLSLPAIATLKSMNGNSSHQYSYITSPAGKTLLECSDLFNEVIGVEYKHRTSGFPLPPEGVDYQQFSTCRNLINSIDFVPTSGEIPRTELFARAIGLDECDFSAEGWKLAIPEDWKEDAWSTLESYDIKPSDRILAMQVDSKGLSRMWPKARQIELCGIASRRGWKVVLLSDKAFTGYPHYCANLTGTLSVKDYIGMIAVSTVGLSTDSSLTHIAGAIGKPAIGLYGSIDPDLRIAHYKTVIPIVGKAKCVPCNDWQKTSCAKKKRPLECMWSIKAKDVFDTILQVCKSTHTTNWNHEAFTAGGIMK